MADFCLGITADDLQIIAFLKVIHLLLIGPEKFDAFDEHSEVNTEWKLMDQLKNQVEIASLCVLVCDYSPAPVYFTEHLDGIFKNLNPTFIEDVKIVWDNGSFLYDFIESLQVLRSV